MAPKLLVEDPAMKRVLQEAERVAQFDTTTIMIEGDTGTGKEILAHYIHDHSPRNEGPFIVLDCATIPESLLESQLFGHEKGSYTGASASFGGILEQVDGGTLFLDEVASLSERAQAVLIRFIETHEIFRVGRGSARHIDVRIIAASNQNLEALMNSGSFRCDLFHRLHVARLWIPPLKHRPKDICPLLSYYLNYWSQFHQVRSIKLTEGAIDEVQQYTWPGNVRELRNAAERFVIEAPDGTLDEELVQAHIIGPELPKILCLAAQYGGELKDRYFVIRFLSAWKETHGHVTDTAKRLGISASSASRYSRALGLTQSG